ncbi:MAG: 3-methylornithyl-N6-L-lysine dehydrogenase PylD [Coriobacteriia bacterium]|nr:3-methylornithyl-N6-L-lysine dehydrogenase PylD [Coriobacteriia bacterium]
MNSINQRLPLLEEAYRAVTGKSLLEIAHFASGTEYLPLAVRQKTSVAVVPITAGEGLIGDFSETVALILREFADVQAYVTDTTDVAGLNEAIVRDADLVFMADDNVCLFRNLRTGATSDNGFATGRGFAALLYLSAQQALDSEVLILGAGKVGSGAYHFFRDRHVPIRWYDLKESTPFDMESALLARDWQGQAWKYIIDATTCPTFIDAPQVCAGGTISAPGIPFGITEAAVQKAGLVIHDELETGVMSMFCEVAHNGGL